MTIEEIADRLFGAIEAGDIEAVRRLYAPHAIIWLNVDGEEQDVERNLAVLTWATTRIHAMRYENVRRHILPTGFIQQHVLRGQARNGEEITVPACLVVEVRDDHIVRIEEYLDRTHLKPLSG